MLHNEKVNTHEFNPGKKYIFHHSLLTQICSYFYCKIYLNIFFESEISLCEIYGWCVMTLRFYLRYKML